MKRLLFILLWLPLLAHAACCTIVNQGSKADPGTANNSSPYSTAVFTNAVNAGDLLIIAYANDNTNPSNLGLPTLSDGDTCVKRVSQYDTNQAHGTALYTCLITQNVAANTFFINVNKATQTSSVEVAYMEISGWNGSTVLDGAAVSAAMQGTNATVAMTATSVPTDFLVAAFSGRDSSLVTTNSPQTGWTPGPAISDATGITQVAMAYQITSSAGSYTAGWPAITNSGNRWVLVSAMAIAGPNTSVRPNMSIIRVN